ncbi:MAG: aldehyde dehydrogenase [Chitinophagaceae bacterium]|jgi:aldehyde dehydrogenase (NAD+)|nr:aldehyde dehydrogenase [Chitinophagaceae bacterium]OQY92744.1 MAG: aldehyde dehydrogenase family protein [Sphingobacteriales bacterium UTBCD1]
MVDGSLNKMRRYFESGATQSYSFRKRQLEKLKAAILKYEKDLYKALHDDLKKSPEESWVTELGLVLSGIRITVKKLRQWMEAEKVPTNLMNLPSSSYVMKEPMGVVLIIAPWNYPFQLLINPLVGAIAAGNCVVLKASEYAPATDAVMEKMIGETFSDEYILYVQGEGTKVVPELMGRFTFDFIFYTGSTAVGKIIYRMAAEKLIPVTLELGGKSPCVVESDADIKVAARRIGIAKFSAAGQMCVAPDYVLVHESVKEKFIGSLKESLLRFFGDKPESNYNYCRIINEKQFDRLAGYLKDGRVVYGGRTDRSKLFIEPTILDHVSTDAPVMREEIFGPILPVIPFHTMEDARQVIKRNPDPLAFYVYTSGTRKEKEWLSSVPAGGACVNNSGWHLTNHHLPFGGRGFSGIGHYHGKYSFDTFSHKKAVMKTPTWFDPGIKYPPFKGKLKLFKRVIR